MELPNVTDIETLAPPVLLVLFCNFIGWIAGTLPLFNNRYIPLLMFSIGAGVYPFIGTLDATNRHSNVKMFIIGACIGGAAVGTNQVFRQFFNKYNEKSS